MADNSAKDFFDEIVLALRDREMDTPQVYVSKEVLLEFYRGVPAGREPEVNRFRQDPRASGVRGESFSSPETREEEESPSSTITFSLPGEMDWEELERCVSCCTKCPLCRNRKNTVFGQGNRNARLMFIGEGPGAEEDNQGLAFVGEAGQLLTKMISAMQFTREEVYIGNIVKCRPPGNRNPEEGEVEKCIAYIQRQIELVNPEVIVLLGAVPLKAIFGITTGITRNRGKFLKYNGKIPVMPTFHPAFLLRNNGAKREVWEDLQCVMKLLGKTPVDKRG